MSKTLLILIANGCGPGSGFFSILPNLRDRNEAANSNDTKRAHNIQIVQEIKRNCDNYYYLLEEAVKDPESSIGGLLQEASEITVINWTYLNPDLLLRVLNPYRDRIMHVLNPVGFFNKKLLDTAIQSGDGASIIKELLKSIKFQGENLPKNQVYQLISQASTSDRIIVVYEQPGYYGFIKVLTEAAGRYYYTTVHEHLIGG